MRHLMRIVLCCLLAAGAYAQRGGGRGGFGGGGFGGGGFRGGGMHGGFGGGGFGGGGFAGGGFHGGGTRGFIGASHISGVIPHHFGRRLSGGFGFAGFGAHRGFFGGGWGYGVGFAGGYWPWSGIGYWDPFWDSAYAYPAYTSYNSSPGVTVVYVPPAYEAPPPRQSARPVIREYRDEYGAAKQIVYLIAFKDGNIRAATRYWIDGNTLRYVTREGQERSASLETVDRAFSDQLNRDQHVEFKLP